MLEQLIDLGFYICILGAYSLLAGLIIWLVSPDLLGVDDE